MLQSLSVVRLDQGQLCLKGDVTVIELIMGAVDRAGFQPRFKRRENSHRQTEIWNGNFEVRCGLRAEFCCGGGGRRQHNNETASDPVYPVVDDSPFS